MPGLILTALKTPLELSDYDYFVCGELTLPKATIM